MLSCNRSQYRHNSQIARMALQRVYCSPQECCILRYKHAGGADTHVEHTEATAAM